MATSYWFFFHNSYVLLCQTLFLDAKLGNKKEKWKKRRDHFFHLAIFTINSSLGVPKCRDGLSEVIALIVLFFGMWYGADKRKADGIKGTHFLTFCNNFIKSIITIDESPIIHLSMFQYAMNNVWRVLIHWKLRRINVPEKIIGESVYTLLTTHILFTVALQR